MQRILLTVILAAVLPNAGLSKIDKLPPGTLEEAIELKQAVVNHGELRFRCGGRRLVQYQIDGVPVAQVQVNTEPVGEDATPQSKSVYLSAYTSNSTHSVITFTTSETGLVQLKVYDIQGRVVKTLYNQVASSGSHEVLWNRAGSYGRLASGVYFIRLMKIGEQDVKKVFILP